MKTRNLALTLSALALATASFAASAADHTFSNTTPITINDNAAASLYPSPIAVAGVPGNITNVSVTLHGINHTWVGDLNVLLVAPGGQKIALMGRVGSATAAAVGAGDNFVNATIAFAATAVTPVPTTSVSSNNIASGTYLPTAGLNVTPMPGPAPAGPYSTDLSTLNGVAASQLGSWNLYISDQSGADVGSMTGGWSLTISDDAPDTTCASEGYTGAKLTWCKNICENGLTGAVLDTWIHRWVSRYRDLPYCAVEGGGEEEPPPQQG